MQWDPQACTTAPGFRAGFSKNLERQYAQYSPALCVLAVCASAARPLGYSMNGPLGTSVSCSELISVYHIANTVVFVYHST